MPFHFAKWACDRLAEDADFGKKTIIFSNEALFDLGGSKRVTVWCGFLSSGIIGPFFFDNEQGEAVTVNGDHYRAMLNEFLLTKIEQEDIGNV